MVKTSTMRLNWFVQTDEGGQRDRNPYRVVTRLRTAALAEVYTYPFRQVSLRSSLSIGEPIAGANFRSWPFAETKGSGGGTTGR
jgi:hypothetical protein